MPSKSLDSQNIINKGKLVTQNCKQKDPNNLQKKVNEIQHLLTFMKKVWFYSVKWHPSIQRNRESVK